MNNYNKRPYKFLIFILIIIIIVVITIYCIKLYKIANTKLTPYVSNEVSDKVYGVNEYSNVMVSDQKMCEIYLANYLSIIRNDREAAYKLVDSSYISDNNFDFVAFNSLISTYKLTDSKISEYNVLTIDNRKAYVVINTSGNKYTFFPNGVMTYTVKFD